MSFELRDSSFESGYMLSSLEERTSLDDGSLLHESDNSEDSDDSPVAVGHRIPAKRGRKRKYRPPTIPRIVKHDIRRHYSKMLVNVTNQHNISLLKSFYETFADPTKLVYCFKTQHGSRAVANDCYFLRGVREIIHFESVHQQVAPDFVTQIDQTNIHTRSDSGRSEITFFVTMKVSVIYDVDVFGLFEDIMVASGDSYIDRRSEEALDALSFYSESSADEQPIERRGVMRVLQKHRPLDTLQLPNIFDFYEAKHGRPIRIRDAPIHKELTLRFTLTLNEHRQIESVYTGKVASARAPL